MKLESFLQQGVWTTAFLIGGIFAFGRAALVLAAAVAARSLTTSRQMEERIEIFRIACGRNQKQQPTMCLQQSENNAAEIKFDTNATIL